MFNGGGSRGRLRIAGALLTGFCAIASAKEAPTASLETFDSVGELRNTFSVAGQADNANGTEFDATLQLQPLDAWAFAVSAGKTQADQDETDDEFDSTYGSLAVDFIGERSEAGLSLRYSDDSDDIQNQTVQGYAGLVGERGLIGVDAAHRIIQGAVVTTITGPRGRRSRTEVDDITGNGYGAHAAFSVTERALLHASFMVYDYDVPEQSRAFARRFTFLQRSVLTLEDAILDSSVSAGFSYSLDSGSVSLGVTRLEAVDADGPTWLAQVDIQRLLARRYPVTLTLGGGDDDIEGAIVFGGVSVGVSW